MIKFELDGSRIALDDILENGDIRCIVVKFAIVALHEGLAIEKDDSGQDEKGHNSCHQMGEDARVFVTTGRSSVPRGVVVGLGCQGFGQSNDVIGFDVDFEHDCLLLIHNLELRWRGS